MTAKRFKASEYYEVWDNDKFLLSFDQTVDLLNELNDENEQLKEQLSSLNINVEKNCITCKYCKTYDEGEGYGFVSLCDKDCMNTDGYFDWEYHRFKKHTECPLWECDKDKAGWWNE